MGIRLKVLVLWFLILALPLQGFAAAVRMSCMPSQQQLLTIQSQAHVHSMHSDALVAHDHSAMEHADANTDGHHSHSSDSASSHKHTSAFCHTCGGCCIGSFALPSQVTWALPTSGLSAETPRPATLLAGFIPDSLDRPPRHTSA